MSDPYAVETGLEDLLQAKCGSKIEPDKQEAEKPRGLFNPLKPAYSPQHEKYSHRMVAMLKAACLNDKQVAEIVGLTPAAVGYLKKQPWFEELVLTEIQKRGGEALDIISAAAAEAAQNLVNIMRTAENVETKRKASNDVLDRKFGKPNQPLSMQEIDPATATDAELLGVARGGGRRD